MNRAYISLTTLLYAIDLVRGRTNPNKFYSTFDDGTYHYASDFSKHNSYVKLRDHLRLVGAARNDSPVIILNTANIPVHYYGLQYHISTYEDVTERSAREKLCHLRTNEIKELSDIFIENLTQPVEKIYWTCPAYAWCCGAECCQHYYRNPLPVLGPDLYGLLATAAFFLGVLLIFELFRRWRKKQASGMPLSTTAPVETIEHDGEKAEITPFTISASKPVV